VRQVTWYRKVASSRSGATEVWRRLRRKDGEATFALVEYLKSGRTRMTGDTGIPDSLTIRYKHGELFALPVLGEGEEVYLHAWHSKGGANGSERDRNHS